MKKIVLMLLLFLTSIFANENLATKDDIKELAKTMRENNKLLLEVMKVNQEATNKRFEAVDKRFEDVNRRFDDMNSKFNLLVTIMIAGFGIIMGYLIKERNSIKKDIKSELEEELTKKADKVLVEDIIKTLIKVSKNKKEYEPILHKYHII